MFHVRELSILAAGTLALCSARAASADAIATDRPGNGNAASVVTPYSLQLETSTAYASWSGGSVFNAPTALRLGLPRGLELRFGSSLLNIVAIDGVDTEVEASDTIVGVKWGLLDQQQGARPTLAVMVDTSLPTGGDASTADTWVPDARVAASWALPAGFGFLVNVGVDAPKDAQGRFARIVYVANIGYSLTSSFSVFAESFGRVDTSGDRGSIVQADFGAAYLVTDSVQLDLYTQHGLSDEAPGFQVAVGFSARLF